MRKLTWHKLQNILPALNARWLEDASGLRKGRIYDCTAGRSTLNAEELERIRQALNALLS